MSHKTMPRIDTQNLNAIQSSRTYRKRGGKATVSDGLATDNFVFSSNILDWQTDPKMRCKKRNKTVSQWRSEKGKC